MVYIVCASLCLCMCVCKLWCILCVCAVCVHKEYCVHMYIVGCVCISVYVAKDGTLYLMG